ncbi:LacI family DNA-binding transcriptional regulator [Granulicella sp. S190]|uniref:LacI family DNA-binding transcriptional regulator n=1 Tax=Granulicella sp. S190 TaxID=1747226 RepID=UPI00131EBABF|nr:LacI family DNA-binding transcriptional regulator [Granulicella sp. S190]
MRRTTNTGRITLADVARECGFSSSTVSIVLNEAPLSRYVAAKTKLLIKETSKRLGYRPDASARSLRRRRSLTIGIMVFDISDPFCTLILKGIHKTLQPTGYLPIIMDAHNEPKQFERYLEMMLERRLEALIIVANWLFVDIEMLGELERERIPMVMVGRAIPIGSMSSVMVDNEAGGYAALQHLYQLGHRKIAFVRGPVKLEDSSQRFDGMMRFAKEVGLKIESKLVADLPNASDPLSGFHEGYRLTGELIATGKTFSAIAAFDDLTAFGVVRALREHGLAVPEQCSVIGFDDVPHAALFSPALTTVRQPMEAMGQIAAERVLRGIDALGEETHSPANDGHTLLVPTVMMRESTGRRRR